MNYFFRLVNNDIVDFLVQQAEGIRYCIYEFLKHAPYLLCDGNLDGVTARFSEEASDRLIIGESSCRGKQVVLYCAQCGGGNLSCKGPALAFAKAQVSLAVFENHLQSPPAGIYLPCLCEFYFSVSCEQTIPAPMIGSSCEEYPDFDSSKDGIIPDIIATKAAAVLLKFLLLAFLHKLRCGKLFPADLVFGTAFFSDLDHVQPMASHMKSMDELDHALTCEPAVCQYIRKPYLPPYCLANHLLGKFYFGGVIIFLTAFKQVAGLGGFLSIFEFLVAHAVVAFLALFSDKCKGQQQLGHSVCHCNCQILESKHRLMAQMGVDATNHLNSTSCFLVVCIIKNKAYILLGMICTDTDSTPQLRAYASQGIAPIYIRIVKEAVEGVFSCLHEACEYTVGIDSRYLTDTKKREHYQALEHGQESMDVVAFANHTDSITLGHFYHTESICYVLHRIRHIRFFEKYFDIREKRCNFVYRHGLSTFLVWYLNLLIFLRDMQETMSFFYTQISSFINLRNLNY